MHTLFDNPEVAKANRVLARHEVNRKALFAWLRPQMQALYLRRVRELGAADAFVTADDAREIIDADPRYDGLNRNCLGSLFLGGAWIACGFHRSKTPGSHGNRLTKWRMK